MRATLAALALLTAALPTSAATFTAERLTDGRVALHMRGIIEHGDEAKIAAARSATPAASLLLLDSPGGDLWSSVEIGRLNTLPTEVRTGERCASACATIWASGRQRYIEPGSRVGFHQVSRTVGGHEEPVPWATAELAAYYGRLGFKDEAVRRMTYAAPTSMHWIDDKDAANGIAFAPRPTTSGTPLAAATPTPLATVKPQPK